MSHSNVVDPDEDYIKDFFPATSFQFNAKCGDVASIKASDFADEHRRRHLESFQKSWSEWASYDATKRNVVPEEKVLDFVSRMIAASPTTQKEFDDCQRALRREFRIAVSKSQMLSALEKLAPGNRQQTSIEQFLMKKAVRTHSGVVVITVLTSPGSFSCPQNCHYCPNEPGQPRSYLSTEPAVLRANQNGWDASLQFWDRASTLHHNGHTIDKIEVLVLGGTWSGYPKSYQEEFIRDLFYAANAFQDYLKVVEEKHLYQLTPTTSALPIPPVGLRPRLSLEEEQYLNEGAECRIIGLTLETRPDHISKGELRRLRRFGCTRVQIGIQHTNDEILEGINRGCTQNDAVRAIRLLKDGCFKVDIHLMPDLPGSSPQLDKSMFEFVLSSPLLQADQWKIYPCEVTPFSQIEQWYKEGRFAPYAERFDGQELAQLLVKVKTAVHPWIRLNRVVRDIPNPSIIAGNDRTNLRQVLLSCMARIGLCCRCLRCREVKTDIIDSSDGCLKIRRYETFGGEEYFLSFETQDEKKVFGFLRLRLRDSDLWSKGRSSLQLDDDTKLNLCQTFPELIGCGLIRELHIYGQLVGSHERKTLNDLRPQHTGFGRRLLVAAEVISVAKGLAKMAVIAGIGTRDYYRKFGYEVEGHFMTKGISSTDKVLKWVEELNLPLPLNIQLYDMTTDLGTLDAGIETQMQIALRSQERYVNAENQPEDKERQHRHSRKFKSYVLSPFDNNCSARMKSHSSAVAHVHIEKQGSKRHENQRLRSLFLRFLASMKSHKVQTTIVAAAFGLVATTLLWKRLRRN